MQRPDPSTSDSANSSGFLRPSPSPYRPDSVHRHQTAPQSLLDNAASAAEADTARTVILNGRGCSSAVHTPLRNSPSFYSSSSAISQERASVERTSIAVAQAAAAAAHVINNTEAVVKDASDKVGETVNEEAAATIEAVREEEAEEDFDDEIVDELDLYCQTSNFYPVAAVKMTPAAAKPHTSATASIPIEASPSPWRASQAASSSASRYSSTQCQFVEKEIHTIPSNERGSSGQRHHRQRQRRASSTAHDDGSNLPCRESAPSFIHEDVEHQENLSLSESENESTCNDEHRQSRRRGEQRRDKNHRRDTTRSLPEMGKWPTASRPENSRAEGEPQEYERGRATPFNNDRPSDLSSGSEHTINREFNAPRNVVAAAAAANAATVRIVPQPIQTKDRRAVTADAQESLVLTDDDAPTPPEGPYVPLMMSEFDGELLQIVKNYYLRKNANAVATTTTPIQPSTQSSPRQTHLPYASPLPVRSTSTHTDIALERGDNAHQNNTNNNTNENVLEGVPEPPQLAAETVRAQRNITPTTTTNANESMSEPETYVRPPPLHPQVLPITSSSSRLYVGNRVSASFGSPSVHGAAPGTAASAVAAAATINSDLNSNTAVATGGNARLPHRRLASFESGVGGGRTQNSTLGVGGGGGAANPLFSFPGSPYGFASRQNDVRTGGGGISNDNGGYVPTHTSMSSPFSTAAAARSTNGISGGPASGLPALSSLPSYSSTSFVRAYVSDISLSLEPAIIVSALTAALNIIVVAFLQHHVLDTRDHLGLFLIGSYMIFASYYMIYYFLERFSGSFRRIASQDKKFYIIGNLIKAGILISITPFACIHLVKIIVFDEWESNILRNLGCIYAIPDFISMVIVRRMRWSTWVHHACVVVFNYFSIMNNYQHENVCRCVVVYAAFSSFAYCVNVLLASRFLGVSVNIARVLSFVALVVYALCCAVNWAWQVYYLRRLLTKGHDHWTVYMYMLLISLVMWDDIVLNKWLLHHARNNAYAASQHLQHHRMRQQQQNQQLHQQSSPLFAAQTRPSLLFRSQEERPLPVSQTHLPPRAL